MTNGVQDEAWEIQAEEAREFLSQWDNATIEPLSWQPTLLIPAAQGSFGYEPTNPILANGLKGASLYLQRLRSQSGAPYIFHRLGSRVIPTLPHPLDVYELLAMDATHWAILYLYPYAPNRSWKAPANFFIEPWDDESSPMLKVPRHGIISIRAEDFPETLPGEYRVVLMLNGMSQKEAAVFAMALQNVIAMGLDRLKRARDTRRITEELASLTMFSILKGGSVQSFINHQREAEDPSAPQTIEVALYEADAFMMSKKHQAAAAAYMQVIARLNDEHGIRAALALAHSLDQAGLALAYTGRAEAGLENLNRALQVIETRLAGEDELKINVFYNLTCVGTLANRLDEAFDSAKACIALQPSAAADMMVDQDLAALRKDPRFLRLLQGK